MGHPRIRVAPNPDARSLNIPARSIVLKKSFLQTLAKVALAAVEDHFSKEGERRTISHLQHPSPPRREFYFSGNFVSIAPGGFSTLSIESGREVGGSEIAA
jgi:hypothetical protein